MKKLKITFLLFLIVFANKLMAYNLATHMYISSRKEATEL